MPGWLSEGNDADGAWVETLVENEDDIGVRFEDQPDRPVFTCGYCGARTQLRTEQAAIEWFHSHLCRSDFIEAA